MLVLVVCIHCLLYVGFTGGTADVGLGGKWLQFLAKTDNAYVKIIPDKPLSLKAFTLCMRVTAKLIRDREIILFAYRIPYDDEFNVWIERNGKISFYLRSSGNGVIFDLPSLSTHQTHLCFTWESATGLSAAWMDGCRSAFQVYRKGHSIRPGGVVLIGQDTDADVGQFDAEQSFVGEITDVKLWDYVLPANQIKALYDRDEVQTANVFEWDTIKYEIYNNVLVVQRYEIFCL
ncbi:Pentraxin fusion protein [Triplophysa tibetana]|uniref:Pentraxin family member n=1 Tax=Triplophysa tibetana TaxID=1572043 RepID=A0A5A9N4V0_9TELE|nr:Pentraxin fusion protein [Triplophysa tibetana]